MQHLSRSAWIGVSDGTVTKGNHRLSVALFSVRILREVKGECEMSSSSESVSWLDRWWPLLVILYGVLFVSVLVSFSPTV
jgi:hypothetical protein